MLKHVLDFARQLLTLTQETQQNKSDIKDLQLELKELRDEMQRLVLIVQKITFDVQRVAEREASEREKQLLILRNQQLEWERKFER